MSLAVVANIERTKSESESQLKAAFKIIDNYSKKGINEKIDGTDFTKRPLYASTNSKISKIISKQKGSGK